MNTYRLYLDTSGGPGYDTWEVQGTGIWHALERLRTIHQQTGRLIGYELLKGEQYEQRDTVETKPSRYSMR
jgi:hypothetical protein